MTVLHTRGALLRPMLLALAAMFLAAAGVRADALPSSVDNSKLKYFPPVISQQGGSCAQASGIGYMFTYEINRLLDRDASQSAANRFAYLFTWNIVNEGADNGGFVDEGLGIARSFGVMSEEDYGSPSVYQYKWASGYDKYYRAAHYRVKSILFYDATTDDELTKIKEYLYNHGNGSETGGVLTFSTRSSNWAINQYYDGPSETGYKSMLTKLATNGAHALTIAGYDDTVEYTDTDGNVHLGAFIVVNTWGSWWADEGRFYLPYWFFTHRDNSSETMLSSAMTACGVYYSEPKIMFKLNLSYSSRNDLRVTCGANTAPYASYAANTYNNPILCNQGGDHAMTGSYNTAQAKEKIEMGIDFSDHVRDSSTQYGRYFLNVIRSAMGKLGEGSLTGFSVIDYRGSQPVEYVCRGLGAKNLELGSNNFSVSTLHPGHFSASNAASALDSKGNVSSKTYVVRTAKGRYAKLKFSGAADNLSLTYTILK